MTPSGNLTGNMKYFGSVNWTRSSDPELESLCPSLTMSEKSSYDAVHLYCVVMCHNVNYQHKTHMLPTHSATWTGRKAMGWDKHTQTHTLWYKMWCCCGWIIRAKCVPATDGVLENRPERLCPAASVCVTDKDMDIKREKQKKRPDIRSVNRKTITLTYWEQHYWRVRMKVWTLTRETINADFIAFIERTSGVEVT